MSPRYRRLFRVRLTNSDPRDLDEEFRFHLQMRARELEAQGLSAEQARETAAAEFGDIDDARRFCQEEDEHRMRRYRRGLWMDHLLQDLRYAARSLRAARLTTFIAVVCIAIGVGANLAIFTVVRGVLLRPLPFGSPESLARLGETEHGRGPYYFSPANYLDVATLTQAFKGVALWRDVSGALVTSGAPRQLAGIRATGNLMTVLGARAALGRVFDARDTLSASRVVVLSDQLWRTEFGGDRSILDKQVSIGGASYTVIGVMPPEFNFPIETERRDYWSPSGWTGFGALQNRMNHTAQVIARLGDGIDLDRARVHLDALAGRLAQAFPDQQRARGFSIESLEDATVGDVRRPLLLLMGAVGFVFLIACANMASVLLARGSGRRREVVIRTALGATRSRLVRQLMTECALLVAGGALVGVLTARVALSLLLTLAERSLPRLDAITFDGWTVAIGIAVSAAVILLVSVMPALQATRVDLRQGMTPGEAGASVGSRWSALDSLLGIEAALALLLLVGAGLLIRSFSAVVALDPGFETANRLTFRVSSPATTVVADSMRYSRFFGPAMEQIRRQPGVVAVGATSLLPIQDGTNDTFFFIEGIPRGKDMSTWPDAQIRTVAGDYFAAMGIRRRAGRFFDATDNARSTPVVVVNEEVVRRFFAGRNPVGRRLDPGNGVMSTVIGVSASTRQLIESPPMPEIYVFGPQTPRQLNALTYVVSTRTNPYGLLPAVRATFHELGPTQALFRVGTLDDVIPESLRARKLLLTLLGIFAGLAMALSAAGVYGVTSYAVSRRTREIGIRIALGADGGRVVRMILGEVFRVVGIGAVAGLAAALIGGGVMRSLLFGVRPVDPPSLAAAVVLVLSAGVIAALLPARRASGISPTMAIRAD